MGDNKIVWSNDDYMDLFDKYEAALACLRVCVVLRLQESDPPKGGNMEAAIRRATTLLAAHDKGDTR